mmetsp:Transcript_14244/g.22998  ORF Transcript_14244/g.22998 Transcript_14244/m.22998 type:complete len:109 (+) Transcript_14244:281-607(+)
MSTFAIFLSLRRKLVQQEQTVFPIVSLSSETPTTRGILISLPSKWQHRETKRFVHDSPELTNKNGHEEIDHTMEIESQECGVIEGGSRPRNPFNRQAGPQSELLFIDW